jgi:beta-mannosidase
MKLPQAGGLESFKKYIYLTQVIQSEAMKLQSETFLRNRYLEKDTGLAMTWGALYWQLNDVWQAPTWSTLERSGKWKMAHYALANYFKPIHVHAYQEGDWVKIIANNELTNNANIEINVQVYKYSAFSGVQVYKSTPEVGKFEAQQVATKAVAEILSWGGCESKDHCLIRIQYKLPSTSSSLEGENYLLLGEPKNAVGLTNGNLRIGSVTKDSVTNRFKIEVQSDSIALWVWLDFKLGSGIHGTFSNNGFFQFEPTKIVYFDDATGNLDASTLKNNLEVTSVFENMN